METIKATLENVMQALAQKEKALSKESPSVLLKQALSKKELRHIKFNCLRKGILDINVDNSSWLYQLNLKKAQMLAQLNKKTPCIKDIRFRLGEIK